jgi:hypothetical protein
VEDIVVLAKERANKFKVRNVIVATNSGATVNHVHEVFGNGYLIIAVGNPASAHARGLVYHDGVDDATYRSLEDKGVRVVLQDQSIFQAAHIGGQPYNVGNFDISGHCFDTGWSCSLEDVMRQAAPTGPFNPVAIVSNTLAMFGDGPRVCIEISLMAADSGVLPLDADCISIQRRLGEDSNMPDTAMVLHPARTQDLFKGKLRVKDIMLLPGPKDHWFDNGPLWVG